MNRFYSYLWLRKDGTPYYAGKGSGKRAFTSDAHGVHRPREASRILVFDHPTEEIALESEKAFIKWFGRKDNKTGCLRNRTDGGDGGTGIIWSDVARRQVSKTLKGCPKTKEHAQHIGDGHRGLVYNLGNSWNVGRKQSPKTIEKRRVANAGFKHSDAAKQKMKGPKSPETIARMKAAWAVRPRKFCPHGSKSRKCRECGRERYKKWYARHKKL